MPLRTLIERTLRGIIFRRVLPAEFGHAPIFVSAEAGLRYVFRPISSADPALLSLAREFVTVGSSVWDIGANIGLFTFAAASRAGRSGKIVAVEADITLAQLLQRSALAQPEHTSSVEVVPAAAALELGLRRFAISQRARATNHLSEYNGSTQTGGIRYHQTVVTISLDIIARSYDAPKVLKIDVEGAELEVLKGGQTVLKHAQPIIICEVANQMTAPEVGHLLRECGYQLFDADLDSAIRVPVEQPPYNTLAVPVQRRNY